MERLFLDIAIIASCSAVLAWAAATLRQPIIVAYVLCGVLLGPWGFKAVPDVEIIDSVSHMGVTLLLFMAGLDLHPRRLRELARGTAVLTLGGCLAGWILSFTFLRLWGYPAGGAALGAAALMFSSTILITKLMPATALHHQHMGAVSIAVLIAQDLVAVGIILFLGAAVEDRLWAHLALLVPKAVLLAAAIFAGERWLVRHMMRKADRYHEVLVLLCLGWCLLSAVISDALGLTLEVGAFLAGMAMARDRIALVMAQDLRPIRDFFLVLFFFVLGAKLDLLLAKEVWLPALLLAGLVLFSRPYVYRWLLQRLGEKTAFAQEMGLRMGQASEFALIVCVVATANDRMDATLSQLVQLCTILTLVVSAYVVVMRCPTPIGLHPGLQQD